MVHSVSNNRAGMLTISLEDDATSAVGIVSSMCSVLMVRQCFLHLDQRNVAGSFSKRMSL